MTDGGTSSRSPASMPSASVPGSATPDLATATGWVGFELDAMDRPRTGRVQAVFVDADSGAPTWLIVGLRRRFALFGRRGRSLVAVPLRDCAAAARVWTAHAGEALRTAPTVDPTRPLLREHELAICAHYGIGERVGRAAEVIGRPDGTVTSQPAGA